MWHEQRKNALTPGKDMVVRTFPVDSVSLALSENLRRKQEQYASFVFPMIPPDKVKATVDIFILTFFLGGHSISSLMLEVRGWN